MKIETKFNIGDEVVFIEDRKMARGVIYAIAVKTSGNGTDYEEYDIVIADSMFQSKISANENEIFKTKEELIESLFN